MSRRRLIVVLAASAFGVALAGGVWRVVSRTARVRTARVAETADAVKTWRGGETNACMVTIDGTRLRELAGRYNVAMLCGVGREDADRMTDPAVTVSRAFPIEDTELAIEEAISGPMRVLLAGRAPEPTEGDMQLPPPHEESLWYEVVLLPKGVDAFDVRTLGDVERLGGRRLLAEPRWTVIAIRP